MGKLVQHTPLPHENMLISWPLIELQSSPKKQKNPHDQLIWGANTFQSSIYHRFSLKPGFVFFFLNTPSLWISRLLIELQSPSKNENNPHNLIIWGGDTFQSSIYHRFSLKPFFFFFFLNTPSLWTSRLLIELQSSSKSKNNPHSLLIWGGDTFQSSIYHSFALKLGCVNKICSIKKLIKPTIFL